MEGNFISNEDAMDRPLRSELGHSYERCRAQAEALGQCIEQHHLNKSLVEGACKTEREALRTCVDADWRSRWKPKS